jgi:hypothetical protein
MTGRDRVEDDEDLYRRVRENTPAGQVCFEVTNGRVTFSQAAFNDPRNRPSVDRAKLRDFDPQRTRISREDGIVALLTGRVRQLGHVQQRNQNGHHSQHAIDVVPEHEDGNSAHAVITTQPPLTSTSAFKRLKESLARLATEAGWRVEPGTELPRHDPASFFHRVLGWARRIFQRTG